MKRPAQALGVLLYASFIIAIISYYVGIFIPNKRQRQVIHQHGGPMLATLRREKKIANTVGLILMVLCFTFISALICPSALAILGFSITETVAFSPFYHMLLP